MLNALAKAASVGLVAWSINERSAAQSLQSIASNSVVGLGWLAACVLDSHAVTLQHPRRPGGGDEREAHLHEPAREAHHRALVAVLHRDENLLIRVDLIMYCVSKI